MRRRRETSKVVLAVVLVVCFVFTGIIIYGWLVLIVPTPQFQGNLAPAATAIGFYAWKAKAENQIKLKKRYGIKKELEE